MPKQSMDLCYGSLYFLLPIFLGVLVEIRGFNLDVRIPVIKQGVKGSYFGFSATGHTYEKTKSRAADGFKNSVLLIGAPKFNTPEQGLDKPAGAIFKCQFSSETSDCQRLFNDTKGNLDESEDKTGQWLGVRVASQGPGGIVAACAHRYKHIVSDGQGGKEVAGYGYCWKLSSDLSPYIVEGDGRYLPCTGHTSGSKKQYYGLCQAGTALYLPPRYSETDDSEDGWWLLGVPGAGDWRGGVFGTSTFSADGLYNVHTPLVDSAVLPDDEFNSETLKKLGVSLNSYLGFSVTAGVFSDERNERDERQLQVVAGAPRTESMGAVVIFKPRTSKDEVEKQYKVNGTTMTESFGYSVCVADLNGDGYDDLIVGAPLYYDRYTNAGGRVYIYINKDKSANFSKVKPIILEGKLDSMFGISVINVGDLNLDGKQDIAIGAPYENNGEGVVYIYHGSKDGIAQPPTQVIRPSDLPQDLPLDRLFNYTFGYSLSGRIDLDGNDYPELVVGSWDADTVVILRGRPIVNINASLVSSRTILDPEVFDCDYDGKPAICFNVSVVMRQYTRSLEFEGEEVDVLYSIEAEGERRNNLGLPPRAIFEKTEKYRVINEKMKLLPVWEETETVSEQYRVIIQKGFTDIFHPITFSLSFWIDEKVPVMPDPGEKLPDIQEYPILEGADPDGVIRKDEPSLSVDFAKECLKDDDRCITDLSIRATTNVKGDPPLLYVGGDQKQLEITIEVKNKKESAYNAKIEVVYPEYLQFSVFNAIAKQKCTSSDAESLITCNLGNPFPTTMKPEILTLKFDPSGVPATMGNLTISINATSANEDDNPNDNTKLITVDIIGVTDIQVFGEDIEGDQQYPYSGKVLGESAFNFTEEIGSLVMHRWKVTNNGPTSVNSSTLTIYFPFESSLGKWFLYMTNPPEVLMDKGSCEVDPELINPAGYKKRTPLEEFIDYENTVELSTDVPSTDEPTEDNNVKKAGADTGEIDRNSKRKKRYPTETVLSRRKRESDNSNGKTKTITLTCMSDAADAPRCFPIVCAINALNDGESATVILRSRVWNSTYIEDYVEWSLVILQSYGLVEIINTPYVTQNQGKFDNDDQYLSTQIRPEVDFVRTRDKAKPVAWWIILLAVLGGLLLLLLLIFIFWKCGFFVRERVGGYKYAEVEQVSADKGKTDKRIYYDDSYK